MILRILLICNINILIVNSQRNCPIMQPRKSHTTLTLSPSPDLYITLSSDFDSGNLQSASIISISNMYQNQAECSQPPIIKLQLIPSGQPFNPQYSSRQSNKNFFHFFIKSNKNVVIHAYVRRMNILGIIEGSFEEMYRIVVGHKAAYGTVRYQKVQAEGLALTKIGEQYTLEFQYQIQPQQKVYFAYHFPYSYQKICHYLQDLDQHFKHSHHHTQSAGLLNVRGTGIAQPTNIYFRNQLLIQSLQGRQINLLTITQLSSSLKKSLPSLPREPRISKSLFPYYDIEQRPHKFNKPYIMMTSRVHPGQTSASYALEGFINRLLGSSPEAEFLRKCFVFLIVPMINPDGVYHGTYRMDTMGHNLNRFYNSCAAHKQPAIFAISTLLQHHSEQLAAFFDLHSHPQSKGSFAYGNAFSLIEDQTQSQIFTKLLSMNSQSFQYQSCTFSQKNMNSKDINDILTKDGSGRVCAYKKMCMNSLGGPIHCFAIQIGYHGTTVKKQVNRCEQAYEFKSAYKREVKEFGIQDYVQIGTDIINTLTQVYIHTLRIHPNPQAQLQSQTQEQQNYLQQLREQTAKQIYERDQRFRILDSGLYKRIKNIQNIIFGNFYYKLIKKYPHILQFAKQYDSLKGRKDINNIKNSKNGKQCVDRNIKVVHSVELGKNSYHNSENKKLPYNNQLDQDLKRLKQKLPPKDLNIKNLLLRANMQKVSVVPLQFQMPTSSRNSSQNRNFRKRDINYNRILQMQADALPKIQKKKFNLLTQRLKIKQKRIESSINTHGNSPFDNFILPVSRGGLERKLYRGVTHNDKGTIDSNIDDIIQYENLINVDAEEIDEDSYQRNFKEATENYVANYNPQNAFQLNVVRNQIMFPRESQSKLRHKLQINPLTQRIHHRRLQTNDQRKRSKSRQKLIISANNNNTNQGLNVKALPKLHNKIQRMKNKFDLELKMKQKYDKQYKLDDKIKVEAKQKLQ